MSDRDVTELVAFGAIDGELLPLEKCVCGREFPYWEHTLGIYREDPTECPACGRLLYFRATVQVFEVGPE